MTIKHVTTAAEFNKEQHMRMRTDSFQTAGRRVYLFEGATVLVDIATNTITEIAQVQGMAFDPMIAVKRIAYYLGFVYYKGERHELQVRQSGGLFDRLKSLFA